MTKKLIFFDVDGTIIDGAGCIPPSAVQAIQTARRQGTLCIVNTGRPYSHIDPAVKGIGFDGYICSCGQHIVLGDAVVHHAAFPAPLCREIATLSRQCNVDTVYEGEDGIWFDLTHPPVPAVADTMEQFSLRGFDIGRSTDVPGFSFDKFCVFVHPDSKVEPLVQLVAPHCTVIYREGDMLEIILKDYSKEVGLKKVIQLLDIPLACCYAIGDSTNDLPMLTCVPHSIAMGNAPDEVRAVVEYVTAPLDADGLAKALAHFGLFTPDAV